MTVAVMVKVLLIVTGDTIQYYYMRYATLPPTLQYVALHMILLS